MRNLLSIIWIIACSLTADNKSRSNKLNTSSNLRGFPECLDSVIYISAPPARCFSLTSLTRRESGWIRKRLTYHTPLPLLLPKHLLKTPPTGRPAILPPLFANFKCPACPVIGKKGRGGGKTERES